MKKHPKSDFRLNQQCWAISGDDIPDAFLQGSDYELTQYEGEVNLNRKERNLFRIPRTKRKPKDVFMDMEEAFRRYFNK